MRIHLTVSLMVGIQFAARASGGPSPAPAPPAAPPHARIAQLYRSNCAGCHGEKGDGNGPKSHFLVPRPRDFAEGEFKIRSTAPGDIPTQEDLERTVQRGVPGTAMPAFGQRLSTEETRAVIEVLRSFSSRFDEDGPGMPLEFSPAPGQNAGTLARGRAIYDRLDCTRCHGPSGRGDGQQAGQLRDATCFLTRPRDFSIRALYKGGATPEDIFRTLSTGMDGTPMTALRARLPDAERWDLAYFISSLARSSP